MNNWAKISIAISLAHSYRASKFSFLEYFIGRIFGNRFPGSLGGLLVLVVNIVQ